MSYEMLQVVLLAAFFIVGAIMYYRSQGKINPEQLAQAAQMAVMAAEQYRSTGQLQTNDDQLKFAIQFVKSVLPIANAIPEKLIIDAIHAFVPAANAVTAEIMAAKATVENAEPSIPPLMPTISNPVSNPPRPGSVS
jgi:hypothetical protein